MILIKFITEGDIIRIMAIAPYNGLKELMINMGKNENFELQVEVGDLKTGVMLAKQAVTNGIDVIISRGGTADLIQKEVSIPVIESILVLIIKRYLVRCIFGNLNYL